MALSVVQNLAAALTNPANIQCPALSACWVGEAPPCAERASFPERLRCLFLPFPCHSLLSGFSALPVAVPLHFLHNLCIDVRPCVEHPGVGANRDGRNSQGVGPVRDAPGSDEPHNEGWSDRCRRAPEAS